MGYSFLNDLISLQGITRGNQGRKLIDNMLKNESEVRGHLVINFEHCEFPARLLNFGKYMDIGSVSLFITMLVCPRLFFSERVLHV